MSQEYTFRLDSSLFFSIGRALQKGFLKRSIKNVEIEVVDSEIKITTDRGGGVISCRGTGSVHAVLSATGFTDLVKSRYRETSPQGEMWIKFNVDAGRISVEGAAARTKEIKPL
jgi:hypothetical protein